MKAIETKMQQFREDVLSFYEALRITGAPYGRYRYAACQTQPICYASVYAALARHLLGALDGITASQRSEWAAHIQSFQDDDGFFKDPPIAHEGSWYVPPHMEWCGWWHLSCHAIMGLAALGAIADKEFAALKPFCDEKRLRAWLSSRDIAKIDFVGNEILNVGQLLQYARDFQHMKSAARSMEIVFDWLDGKQDPATGLWGDRFDSPQKMNQAYQGAYHFYLLYEYDRRPVRYRERIIDSMLSMQTAQGGFGIHENTSGCEDIDAIDPLARFYRAEGPRAPDIEVALKRAYAWVLENRTADGGFTFIRDREMFYGSRLMYSGKGEGSSFATWWRMLSLALMARVVGDPHGLGVTWQYLRCPGYHCFDEVRP